MGQSTSDSTESAPIAESEIAPVPSYRKVANIDHRHAFMAFVAALLGDFDRYLARGEIDLLRDGVSYDLAGTWLDDAELIEPTWKEVNE